MLSTATKVFVSAFFDGNQYWATKYDTKRFEGRIVPSCTWGSPEEAKNFSFEFAVGLRASMLFELKIQIHFALSAGGEFVEEVSNDVRGEDHRVAMTYRGLVARPGVETTTGDHVWYCHLYDESGRHVDSFRGATPEAVIDLVFAYKKENQGEKSKVPAPQAPQPVTQKVVGPRVRPGDIRR